MLVTLPIVEVGDPRPDSAAGIAGPRDIRFVRTLRISVTDRCNFRCVYCMPEEKLDWVPRDEVLSFEEIGAVVRSAVGHGIGSFKLTGGEPLVRQDIARLVGILRGIEGVRELSMTTNGSLLDREAEGLRRAGLDRLTVSLDTMDGERFRRITRGAEVEAVWRGIAAARAAGFGHPKLNVVAMRGINEDEFAEFAGLTVETDVSVRFIEYMPLGRTALGGEYEERFVGEEEIRGLIEARYGALEAARDSGLGPAKMFRIAGAAGRIGFISAMSKPFCETCNRLRLTAEGQLRSCLFDGGEVELRPILRGGAGLGDTKLALSAAFVRCASYKPEVHSYFGDRQMSQMGG